MITDKAISRRAKMHVLAHELDYIAVCPPGLEPSVQEELKMLSPLCSEIRSVKGGVIFRGRSDAMYAANLNLSTASRVLLRIEEFSAPNTQALFNRVKRMRWEIFLGRASNVRLSVTAKKSRLNHNQRIMEIVCDALNERLQAVGLTQTVTQTKHALLEFLIRIQNDRCMISFNTSGEHLHRRGWRLLTPQAPIRETLAAYVLRTAQVRGHDLIVDPFCGSGTIVIEAAKSIARHAPGGGRSFAFEYSPIFEERKWKHILAKRKAGELVDIGTVLIGSDIDSSVVNLAKSNATSARVQNLVEFHAVAAEKLDYKEMSVGTIAPLLASNLPYGKRLRGTEPLDLFLTKISTDCKGWAVALICADSSQLARLQLKNKSITSFTNGGLRVSLVRGQIT